MKRQWEKNTYHEFADLYIALEKIAKEKTDFKAFKSYPYTFCTITSKEIPANKMVEIVMENVKGDKRIDILDDNILLLTCTRGKTKGDIKVEVDFIISTWAESVNVKFVTESFTQKTYIMDCLEELIDKTTVLTRTEVKKVIYK